MLILGHRANHAASLRVEKVYCVFCTALRHGQTRFFCVAISRADSLPSVCHLILRAGFMSHDLVPPTVPLVQVLTMGRG